MGRQGLYDAKAGMIAALATTRKCARAGTTVRLELPVRVSEPAYVTTGSSRPAPQQFHIALLFAF
jgi:hypothetical protein